MAHLLSSFSQAQQQFASIEAIDYFFAKEIASALTATQSVLEDEQQLLMPVLIALSSSLRAGHTCLPLVNIATIQWGGAVDEYGEFTHQGFIFPSLDVLTALMVKFNLDFNAQQPIVFDHNKLYIRRYYQFEWEVAQGIRERLADKASTATQDISIILAQLFPRDPAHMVAQSPELDWQMIAVANAINKNFTVIAGGPGTGKTYTVTKLLAALLMLHSQNHSVNGDTSLEIALVAPTGKAAQRLSESIIKTISGFKGLIDEAILAAMPTQAKTIHRILGVIPNSPNFRYNQDNLLTCDVLLIDEVSMVDLPLMARIFRAIKPDTKLILLGDADQLPSVAVGSILADIAPRPHKGYSEDNLHYLAEVCQTKPAHISQTFTKHNAYSTTFHDHLSFLIKSRRFDGESGIAKLAANVIQGQYEESWQLLTSSSRISPLSNPENELTLADNNTHFSCWLEPLVKQYYKGIARCSDVDEAFVLFAKFRVLCVTRQGELGVDAINQWITEQLVSRFQVNTNYHGMPIMICENDYRLGLYNGDIGMLWRTDNTELMAYFEQAEHKETQHINSRATKTIPCYKTFMPSRLSKYEVVYAMTIHKTQGSEFEHVAIVLPKQANHQLLSRELLYTGITRAKTKLTIASNKPTWHNGVQMMIKRYSGLTL